MTLLTILLFPIILFIFFIKNRVSILSYLKQLNKILIKSMLIILLMDIIMVIFKYKIDIFFRILYSLVWISLVNISILFWTDIKIYRH